MFIANTFPVVRSIGAAAKLRGDAPIVLPLFRAPGLGLGESDKFAESAMCGRGARYLRVTCSIVVRVTPA